MSRPTPASTSTSTPRLAQAVVWTAGQPVEAFHPAGTTGWASLEIPRYVYGSAVIRCTLMAVTLAVTRVLCLLLIAVQIAVLSIAVI